MNLFDYEFRLDYCFRTRLFFFVNEFKLILVFANEICIFWKGEGRRRTGID